MATPISEEEIYQKARKRVEEKKSFFSHLAVYIVVNAVLILIWAFTSPGYPWFVWPLGGWGIGLIFHFLGVFLFNKETGWERNEVEKEAEKIRKSTKP
jgi:hypothetical protein